MLFLATWWKAAVGIVIGALLCWPLAQCRGEQIGQLRMETAIEKANVETLRQKARADELAAAQRLTDTIAVSRQEQELRNVVAQTPDSLPDAARIALGCERLRRAHSASPAALPAVCRPPGGAQAPAQR